MKIIDLKTYEELEEVPDGVVAALGNFDGVHLGHMALLNQVKESAASSGLKSAVWSFDGYSPRCRGVCITSSAYRTKLFAQAGIEYLYLYEYSDVRTLSAREFVKKILIDECNIVNAVCGYNFRFGYEASGRAADLISLMEEYGRKAICVPAVTLDGETVSSTAIRGYLCQGEPSKACAMLGRPFSVKLPVVHGRHLGTKLGFPTMNQNFPPEIIVPRRGVYACYVRVDGKTYTGAANIGLRPTVDGAEVNCETHIIGYDGDLYYREIEVDFIHFIRPERKFESLDALKSQIRLDVEAVEKLLKQ